jgi:hypothetical protein
VCSPALSPKATPNKADQTTERPAHSVVSGRPAARQ